VRTQTCPLLRPHLRLPTCCQKYKAPLRLIALIKSEAIAKQILTAMHLPVDIPQLRPARPPPQKASGSDDWLNQTRPRQGCDGVD
jgi:hypothetical protein